MKIAVIGAGISGLVAAYRLGAVHDVTLFEAHDSLGGHTQTIDVELDGERHAIDVGFIVFNDWTYPRFIALLDELGVASRPTTMSFSVRDDATGLEYNGHSLNTLFAQRRNLLRPSFHRMLRDIVRFNRHARRLVEETTTEITVGEFLAQHRFSDGFSRRYLLPMGSAIWSCPTGTFAQFPMRAIVEFYHNHGLLSIRRRPTWRVVDGGSRNYVTAIERRFRGSIRRQTPIAGVYRLAEKVVLQPHHGPQETFDHVIFACHSDQALKILGDDATATERQLLSAFPYVRNAAVLHTDATVLPHTRRAWASWNYRLRDADTDAGSVQGADAPASVTYNMNILQGLRSHHTFCVTLNDESRIDPQRILRRFVYHHPVFTLERSAAQARHAELLDARRTSFCGAYWRHGFHEDGVVSALAVVKALAERDSQRRIPPAPCAGAAP